MGTQHVTRAGTLARAGDAPALSFEPVCTL